jgi:hypothetical protein
MLSASAAALRCWAAHLRFSCPVNDSAAAWGWLGCEEAGGYYIIKKSPITRKIRENFNLVRTFN